MENKKILVIGSINADYVIHTERMLKLGETVVGEKFEINCGGKGFNQAVAIAKLGGNVSFLGALGNDANGNMLFDALNEYGIRFEGINDSPLPTGIAMITVVDSDNCIVLSEGANRELTPEFIEQKTVLIKTADYIVLQLEIPTETVVRICEIAKQGNAKIILNPAPYKQLPLSLYPMIDYLIPNEHEASLLTGIVPDCEQNCITAVNVIKGLGVKNVIITLGARGCVYNINNEVFFCAATNGPVIDTTSAGDSFIGAFTVKTAEGASIDEAIDYANKVAAITVSRNGAAKSIPFAYELEL